MNMIIDIRLKNIFITHKTLILVKSNKKNMKFTSYIKFNKLKLLYIKSYIWLNNKFHY